MLDFAEWAGYAAGTLTTVSFAPQAWRISRTRNTKAISLPMYILFTLGILCWLTYGVLLDEMPMILANGTTLALALYVLVMKIRYG